MNIKLVVFGLSLLLAYSDASSKSRQCTHDEKVDADAYLLAIEADPSLKEKLVLEHLPFGLPVGVTASDTEEVLVNGGYVMLYDHDLRTALWTSYHLTQTDRSGAKGKIRVDCFRPDPRIEHDGPVLSDYKEPIFDRGHLANDADLKDELREQLNSYVLTNMSPQHCRFNRGIWLTAENLTRHWASTYNELYIITGVIFDRNDDNVRDSDADAIRMKSNNGQARVAVPSSYYKVIYRPLDNGEFAVIAMMLEHDNDKSGTSWKDTKKHVQNSILPLSELEDAADFTFFPPLVRNNMTDDLSHWDMTYKARNMEFTCR